MRRLSPVESCCALGVFCALLLASGCSEGGTDSGALGQVEFAPECGSMNQACLERGLDAPVAAYAELTLGVDFRLQGTSGPPVELVSADTDVFEVEERTLRSRRPGLAALLVIGPGDAALDFIHVWVVEADELRLVRRTDAGASLGEVSGGLQLFTGDSVSISVEPYGEAQGLLGHFAVEWEVEGESVMVVKDGLPGRFRIVAVRQGRAQVHARWRSLETTLDVEVMR